MQTEWWLRRQLTPSKVLRYLEELNKLTGIHLKLIHVVRNPSDNIATINASMGAWQRYCKE